MSIIWGCCCLSIDKTWKNYNFLFSGKLVAVLFNYGNKKRDGKDLVHFLYHYLSSYDSDTEVDSSPVTTPGIYENIIEFN